MIAVDVAICQFEPSPTPEGKMQRWICPVCKTPRTSQLKPFNRVCAPDVSKPLPSIIRRAGNLMNTGAAIVADGAVKCTAQQIAERLAICAGCSQFNSGKNACSKCGCNLQVKPIMRASDCPLEKWPKIQKVPMSKGLNAAIRKTETTVAVAIISHNYGRFLGEAIESVLAQTVKPVEIVVIDDSSTDDTAEVAARYADRTVRYHRIVAQDVNQARQAGFEATSSTVICFLDADDKLPPDYIATGLPHFSRPEVAIVYGDQQQFEDRTGIIKHPEWGERSIHWENFIHSAAMIRRSAIEITNTFENLPDMTECAHHNDWAMYRRILTGPRIAVKQVSPQLYRIHGENWLTKSKRPGLTYYDRAALYLEPVTIYVPMSGREPKLTLDWLDQQLFPTSQCRLVLLDTSHSLGFNEQLHDWAPFSNYPDVRIIRREVGARGLANKDCNNLEVQHQTAHAMYKIYDPLWNLDTEYIFTLEDDVTPPLDVIDRLMRQMGSNVFSVASPYRSRYGGWAIWDDPYNVRLPAKGRYGVKPTGGNGFGATLLRRSVLSKWAIGPGGGRQEYDLALYKWLADQKYWRALLDWDAASVHAGLKPDDAR